MRYNFKRRNFEVEVGLHAINGLREGEPQQKLLIELNVWNKIKPLEIKEFYHFRIPKLLELEFPTNAELARHNLNSIFPKEISAIDQYFHDLKIAKEINWLLEVNHSQQLLKLT